MDKMDLLKKLNELAKRGEGGEKINAEAQLKKLCEKYNIDPSDVEGDKIESHPIRVSKEFEQMFHQVHSYLFGKDSKVWSSRARGYKIVDCTMSDFLLLEATFSFYKKQFQIEQKRLYTAFIMKHKLYPKDGDKISPEDLTKEEMREILRASEMASSLEDVTMRKLLEAQKQPST